MHGVKMMLALLAAGSLALGAGTALAATGQAKAPEPSKTPAVSKASATPMEQEAKETQATQQTEKARASQEKAEKEKEAASDRIVRGRVSAVEPSARTLTVTVMRHKKAETVGVDVPDSAKITQGKATKTLADVKVGDRVWMQYDRMNNKLVADHIRILRSAQMASQGDHTNAKKTD